MSSAVVDPNLARPGRLPPVTEDDRVGPTRYRLDPERHLITWRLDTSRDNDVFDDNWGWWQLVADEAGTLVVYANGSVGSSGQPLAGFFERRGIIEALTPLRDAAVRRGWIGTTG